MEVQKNAAAVSLAGQCILAPQSMKIAIMRTMILITVVTKMNIVTKATIPWLQMPLPDQAIKNFHMEVPREVTMCWVIPSSHQIVGKIGEASVVPRARNLPNRQIRKHMRREQKQRGKFNCQGIIQMVMLVMLRLEEQR